jgi:hypothetical protein
MRTVKQLFSTTVACISAVCAHAQTADEALFPAISTYSDEVIRLHGLAHLYPDRVLFEAPQRTTTTASRVATRVEDLPRGIKYIRFYRLDEAQAVLAEFQAHPALILDLRFLKSQRSAAALFDPFASIGWADTVTAVGDVPEPLIHTQRSDSYTVRDTPVIVLCNRETAGPFEAILHRLQEHGSILAVGESTAGRTGFYQKETNGAWILHGELRPDAHTSLVGRGFEPRIQIPLSPEKNYLCYHLYEAGTGMTDLLRQAPSATEANPQMSAPPAHTESPNETDTVLQRGVDMIVALQTLQQQTQPVTEPASQPER